MKQKVIYLFAMLCFAQAMMAQEQKPYLVTEGKQWAVYFEQSWNQEQPVVTYTFRLQGDTIINGFTYKKKWMSLEKDLSDWFLIPNYMREENGKVYVMNSRGEEALWFDYNAQVGDTLCLTSKQATLQCYGLVTSIDDVVLEHSDGKQRKRYEVVLGREAMSGDVYFTDSHIYIHEDVGMFNSPNYGYGLGDHTLFNYGNRFKLLCVHDNGIALYQSPEGCYKEVTPKTYLVTEGKQWAVYHDNPLCSKHRSGTITYKLQGDTILHGKTYKKKWISYKEDLSDMQPYNSFMREENGKVYIADIYGEELWFDYTAQVGDTLCFKKGSEYGRIHDIYDAFLGETDSTKSYRCYQMQVGKYNSQKRQVEFIDQYISVYESLGVVGRIMGYGLSEHHYQNSYGKCGFTLLCVHDEGKILYQTQEGCYKPLDEKPRPTNRKGYGIYYDDSFLYRYTINEAEEVTDSTDFARWYDKTVIYFDIDSVGRDAFANACFRQGQILYFTEKLRYIGQDAFGDILMLDDEPEAKNPFGDLCIVFSGENPPSIDENSIVNYADTTYSITYVVPDLATYIEDDMQWTYSQLVTIDDFIAGYVSPENEIVVSDSAGVDLEVGVIEGNILTGAAALYVAARPKKDIPVRIGDGENKDIYSRAPAWMCYTVEVVMTDSKGDTLYTDKQQCNAYDKCYFEVKLTTLPEDGIVCVYSRSIDQYGNASDWTMKKIHLMNIDSIAAPENHSPYYDLQGREVAYPTRGIYIKDGRKVVIK